EGIGRRNKSEVGRKLQVISEEIPCTLYKGDCNNGETDPSKLGLAEALSGDPSVHVGQTETAEKERENPKNTVHASNKDDSESSEWETGSEEEESVGSDENQQSIFNKDPKQLLLNANVNSGERTKDSSGEKIALSTLEARDPNFDSPKLKGNFKVVLDVEDEKNAEWSTVSRKSYHGFRGGWCVPALGIVEDRRNGTVEKVAGEVELNLPTYVLFSSPVAMLCVVLSLPKLLSEQQIPCKGATDSLIEIVGLPRLLMGDFPDPFQEMSDPAFHCFQHHFSPP
ncbi:hypothetical protein KI387_033179, partial [Taxus chinensis]